MSDQLIVEAATGARQLTTSELGQVLEHVARAGFDPNALERVRGWLAGVSWRGMTLRGRDRLPPAEVKYLWHVVSGQEWPLNTSLQDYFDSIRRVILDPRSGVFIGRYQGAWQLGVVRDADDLRGPGGSEWVLVEYRLVLGHWVTALQPRVSRDAELRNPRRDSIRWLRHQQLWRE